MALAGDQGGDTDSFPASPHRSGAVTDMKKQPLRGQHHIFLCWMPFYSIPQQKQPSTGLPRGAGRSIHSLESLTSSRSLARQRQQARQGPSNDWAALGSAWGNRGTFTAIAIHCVQPGRIQLHMHLSNKPSLEKKCEQSKQWGGMHGGTAGFHSKVPSASMALSQGGVSCLTLQTEWILLL